VSYNLLEENWIPVLWKDGRSDRLGIRGALEQAHRIRQIAATNPMDRLAILRFLLALLYWCQGNPSDRQEPICSFPSGWFKKLDESRDCFSLLGEGKRFYQCRASSGKEGKLSANYLIHEVPTGTTVRHLRHSTDYQDGLCPACCAIGLLRLPAFATQGGQGKSPGINQKPPVYVLPVGGSLAETLRLSWRKVAGSDLGVPAWEKPDLNLPKHGNVPLLMGLTWLPRRVWLDDPEGPEGNCIACARRGMLIRQSVFAGLGSAKAAGRVWKDPHTIGEGDAVVRPSDALGAPDAAAGGWARAVERILAGRRPPDGARLWIVGFATDQNKLRHAN
jgi:CRISPR type I-E-associated protein CasA/Cse1